MESGALSQLRTFICIRVPNLLRRIAQQLSGEAGSMSLLELIVNENLIL